MADVKVELVITADNKQAVNNIKETQKATEDLNKAVNTNYQDQQKAVKETIKAIDDLAKARDKANDPKKIADYNKKINEAKVELQQLGTTYSDAIQKTETWTQKISKWALGLGGAVAASKILIGTIKELTVGINAFNMAGAVTKQILYNLTTGAFSLSAGLGEVVKAQRLINDLRLKEVIDIKRAKEQQILYNKYYFEAVDRKKTDIERIGLLDKAMKAHNKMIDIEVEDVKEQAAAVKMLSDQAPGNEKLLMKWANLQIKLLDLESQRYSGMKRLESMRTSMEEEAIQKRADNWGRYMNEIEQANEEADRKEKERINEKYQLWLDYYDWYRDQIDKTIKDEEQAAEAKWDFDTKWAKQLFDNNKELAKEQWEALNGKDGEVAMSEEEKWKNIISITEDSVDKILDSYNELREGQFEDAQRHREILDQRVSETQSALEAEIELYKAGYASNVAAKEKELADLKRSRDLALREEEEARKKQLRIEAAMQAASLASAVANLFSKETKKLGVFGLISAGIGVASMFAAFVAAVARANQVTKLAEGGFGSETGLVTGRTHAQGGERFLDHVEIERGERWGVLNRRAAERFGHTFEDIVSSFNRNEMPDFAAGVNNIIVDNKGSNTRLDRVIVEQKKLNEKLDKQIIISGHRKVVTKGKNIRIVG